MIQVREYALITTDARAQSTLDCAVVSPATFEWLQNLSENWPSPTPVMLRKNHRELKLNSYVGFLQSPSGESIEILPKTCVEPDPPDKTRRVLQKMLLASIGVKPRTAGSATLMQMKQPLHEWIFSQFLTELNRLIQQGLRFNYERIEEESQFIRGQLQRTRQQRQAPGREHRFHITHDVFSPSRLENRLLKTALEYVRTVCKNNENWRLANELTHRLIDIPTEASPLLGLNQWTHNKQMQAYDAIKPWCKLIIEKLNPNFQQGMHQGISLLFPMEQLFEKYVAASLRSHLHITAHLKTQARSKYLLQHTPTNSPTAQGMFQLKPDLLLESSEDQQVLDTKWKLIDQTALQHSEKYGIAQTDLYQMFAYGHQYQQGKGHMMLIYPKHMGFNKTLPAFFYSKHLAIWMVPFCLDEHSLVLGEWQKHFPMLCSKN